MRCNNRDIELYMKGKKDGKEELQERIERAIKYIEDELEWSEPSLDVCDMTSLLKILKGDSNE